MKKGILYLIPVPLAENASAKSFTPYLIDTINSLDTYIVENEKTARKFLKEAGLKTPQSALIIHDYGKHKRNDSFVPYFKELMTGKDVGLMSEAGCPGVADPGQLLVNVAQHAGAIVKPLVGPSSILLALMASGMNGQIFQFTGYLPIDTNERKTALKELENESAKKNSTQIFIETPYRNNVLIKQIVETCRSQTQLCIAVDITGQAEKITTKTIAEWKKQLPDIHKKPAIFLLQA